MTLEEKRDATRIEHMHDAIARIAVIMGSLEKEEFLMDELRCEALAHRLTQLGEAANKLSRAFKAAHPEIDWRRTVEFRNNIVHDYSEISYEEMWQRAETDVVELGKAIKPIYEAIPREPPLTADEIAALNG